MSARNSCCPRIEIPFAPVIAGAVGLVMGMVNFGVMAANLNALIHQDPRPSYFDSILALDILAVMISGLYIMSSCYLTCALGMHSTCNIRTWQFMTVLELAVIFYSLTQPRANAIYVASIILGFLVAVYVGTIIQFQCMMHDVRIRAAYSPLTNENSAEGTERPIVPAHEPEQATANNEG